MKALLTLICLVLLIAGCANHNPRGAAESDSIRIHGTTGFGVGSDTTTQTGIDTGTRSGSSLPPR